MPPLDTQFQDILAEPHNYREVISVFIEDVQRFLDVQECNHVTVAAIIESFDSNYTADNDSRMGKKKAPLKKCVSEKLDAGDALTQHECKETIPPDDASALRLQIDQMREHSRRLIAEYNKKLEALRHENFQLTEEIQHSRTLIESFKSKSEEQPKDHMKMSGELGEDELKYDCASEELQRITSYNKQSVALIASLGAEIPNFKLKRSRIVDNAKRYVALDEEIYNNLINACIAASKVVGRGDEEEQSVIEILFDEVVGKDRNVDYLTPNDEDSDSNSAAVEWTTASSSEPWDNDGESKPKTANLLQKQQELNELLISERSNYEEKLSTLRSIMDVEREKSDALQVSFVELNRKHAEVVAELQRMQGMYSGVVDELEAERSENGKLSTLARNAELETNQIKELARSIEDERSHLRLENIKLVEKVQNLESDVSQLQANESDCKQRYEELAQRYGSFEASILKEREEFTKQIEVLQKTLEDDSESNDSDVVTLKETLESERQKHEEVKEELKNQLSALKESYDIVKQQNEEKCKELFQVTSDLSLVKEQLEEAGLRIDELKTAHDLAALELAAVQENNVILATKLRDVEEIIKSTEQDLEETRRAYAREKEEVDHYKAINQHLEKRLEELDTAANEVTAVRERLKFVESELAESVQQNSHLHSKIADYESTVSKLSEELSSKMQQITVLERAICDVENSSAEIREQSAKEVAKLKEDLTEANALVDKLSCQLEQDSRAIPIKEYEKQMTAAQGSVKVSEDNLKSVTEERDRVIDELNKAKEQLHEMEHDLSEALERCESLTIEFAAEKKKLEDQLETARTAEDSLVKELWKAEEESATRDRLQEQMQEKLTTLLDKSQALSAELLELETQKGEILKEKESVAEENTALQKEVQSIRNDLAAACCQRDELLAKFSDLGVANKELEDRLLSLQSVKERCTSLEAALEMSKKYVDEADTLRKELVSRDGEIDLLRSRTQVMEEELLVVGAEAENLREQVESLTQAVSDRDSSIARCETELACLQMQLRERQERDTVIQLQSSVELKRSEETVYHLRDDNVRLERELFLSHEQLECAKSEIVALQQALDRSDAIALTSRNDNQRLVEELERALFEKEQTLIMAGEGREAAARVIALERSISTLKSEYDEKMKQALEDLDSSEQRLRHLKDTAEQACVQRDESVRRMESWRKRFELAAQEIESLTRSNEEVRHLEAALEKSRNEKSTLYDELSSQRSMLDRILAEKDALLAQVTALNGQLDERTNRLRQAGEAKMDTTLRIVELESQIAALLRGRDTIVEQDGSNDQNPEENSCNELSADQSPLRMVPTEHVAVQIENEEEHAMIERLRTDLQRAEQRIAELEEFERSVGDNHRLLPEASHSSEHVAGFEWPHHFISASSPLPSLVTLLSRRLNALRHRPSRAVLPYFRYAMAAYAVALHIMLIHCWVFSVCP